MVRQPVNPAPGVVFELVELLAVLQAVPGEIAKGVAEGLNAFLHLFDAAPLRGIQGLVRVEPLAEPPPGGAHEEGVDDEADYDGQGKDDLPHGLLLALAHKYPRTVLTGCRDCAFVMMLSFVSNHDVSALLA